MLKDEQIKIGNKFKGSINNCLIEILEVKKELNDKLYVSCKDVKTNKIYKKEYETFKRLLLEEI